MRAENVNLDNLVDYKAEYGSVIRKCKVTGDSLTGLCPFHDDKNNSFSVDLKTGKWKCHAEDRGGNFVTFYAELNGLDNKEAYKQILEKYGALQKPQEKAKAKAKSGGLENYTLAQYAFEKRLPEEWLKDHCHLQTKRDRDGMQYLFVPYYREDSKEATYRKRYANKQFRWKYGAGKDICLYGAWKMEDIRKTGYAALVEGESDSQSMWFMEISTFGVPGASMMRADWVGTLQDLKLYIHVEPDKGGEIFLAKVTQALRDGGFLGEVYKWSCKNIGCKDPSEVYIKYGKEDAAAKILKAIENAERVDLDEDAIPEAATDAPVNLRQPKGWTYSDDGICMIDEKTYAPVMVCKTPIIIARRLQNMDTSEEKIEIAFRRDGEWIRAVYPRSTIFTARGITVLADLGCTITSENAKRIVKFLSALEAENIDIIKKVKSTDTFGWQSGKQFLPGYGKDIILDIDPSQRSMASAYCKSGTMKDWIAVMEPHRKRDKFRFILSASFTAPLLRIIRQRIFFVYNWGDSKGGKTAALKAALSAWGDPDRLMVNFNATQVGLERTASFYCDLPLGIDERQLAGGNQASLEKIVYMISSGMGKMRGKKNGGVQALQTWRTVALATGEEPISTETSQTGINTRVLEIYGGPFDDETEASAMHQQSVLHYGWAGEAFIGMLLHSNEKSIEKKYEEMKQYVHDISDDKNGAHIAGIAAVALADAMIDTWIFQKGEWLERYENGEFREGAAGIHTEGLQIDPDSWKRAQEMAENILQAGISADVGDVNENAAQFIVDWVLSNKDSFGQDAYGTCLGMFQKDNVYIFPSVLTQALDKAGYSARKTMKYLAEEGFIGTAESKGKTRYSMTKRFNGRPCRFVEFHLNQFLGKDFPEERQMSLSEMDGWTPITEEQEEELPFG